MALGFTWKLFPRSFQNAAEVLIMCYYFPRHVYHNSTYGLRKDQDTAVQGDREEVWRELQGKLWRTMVTAGAKAARKYKRNFLFIESCCSSCSTACTTAAVESASLE